MLTPEAEARIDDFMEFWEANAHNFCIDFEHMDCPGHDFLVAEFGLGEKDAHILLASDVLAMRDELRLLRAKVSA